METQKHSMNARILDFLEEVGLSHRIVSNQEQLTAEFMTQHIDFVPVW